MQPDLLGGFVVPQVIPVAEGEELSADRRRTARQHADAARGIHPLMRTPVHPDGARLCGNCRFRRLLHGGNRQYPKCIVDDGAHDSHCAASDVRAWWPACGKHEYGDVRVSPDAARSGPADG